jgi:hypothetical protein
MPNTGTSGAARPLHLDDILRGPVSEGVIEMLAHRNAEKRLAAIRRLGDKWILADKYAVTRREVRR